jgi:hypothetical protein
LDFSLYVRYLTCKIFLSATCTLDEPDKHFSHKLLLYFAFFVKWVKSLTYLRNCIIETVGAIFREYKPWIVLLITQWSKSSKIVALFLGLFCQKFVKKLFAFFSKEKATKKPILSHLIGYIKGHLKLWMCLTLQCTILWMVRFYR